MARISRWVGAGAVSVALAIVAVASGEISVSSNGAAAVAAAPRLLAEYTPPAGAVSAAADPDPAALAKVIALFNTPNRVAVHAFWTAPVPAATVLADMSADPPAGTRFEFGSGGGTGGVGTLGYSAGPVTRVLTDRDIVITVAPLSATTSAIRADGEAVWITPRAASEVIPAGVRTVSVTGDSGLPEPHHPTTVRRFSVTAPVQVASTEHVIDALPVAQPSRGAEACGSDNGSSIVLRFRARSGAALAVATVATSGCGGVSLRLSGRRADDLSEGFPGSGLPANYSLLGALSRALGNRLGS
jgi:hypothetical protein